MVGWVVVVVVVVAIPVTRVTDMVWRRLRERENMYFKSRQYTYVQS